MLLIIGGLIAYYIAPKEGALMRSVTFAVIGWEAFIYLFTALRNPGIASNPNPETKNDVDVKEDSK